MFEFFLKSLFFSFKDTSHTDFVSSLSWQGNDNLFTCGWDSKVKNHCVSKSEQTCEDCVTVQMETDCIDKENVKKKIANISLVCNGNGAGLESTWCASTSIRYIPDVLVFCDSLLIVYNSSPSQNKDLQWPSVKLKKDNSCCWYFLLFSDIFFLQELCHLCIFYSRGHLLITEIESESCGVFTIYLVFHIS